MNHPLNSLLWWADGRFARTEEGQFDDAYHVVWSCVILQKWGNMRGKGSKGGPMDESLRNLAKVVLKLNI